MSSKVLIIISTGEEEKALTGLTYASKTIKEGWLDEVQVLFFGPSERLLIENEEIARMAKELTAVQRPIACKFIADRDGIADEIVDLGLKVVYVGTIIAGFIKQGYIPMVF